MKRCTIKQIKTPDGRTLYLVINDPEGKRLDWRHIFNSKSDAEKCKRELDALGDILPPIY